MNNKTIRKVLSTQKKEKQLKLNMTFEEAMKKALNTPIPRKRLRRNRFFSLNFF